MEAVTAPTLTLTPIGYIRSPKPLRFHAPHQPDETAAEDNVLELLPGRDYERALHDLAGFERVWLLWWFHRNKGWRPMVLPPRGPSQRRGVFATRSPHRPNPLGLTPVRLLGIDGLRLRLGACDLVDGTPVFDIKPYIAGYDAFPGARAGWLDAMNAALPAAAEFTVLVGAEAQIQADWLRENWQVDFMPRLHELLAHDPSPHRTRRIRRRQSDGLLELGCGAWRALFRTEERTVHVQALAPSYPRRFLTRADYLNVPDREAQLAFLARWPESAVESTAEGKP